MAPARTTMMLTALRKEGGEGARGGARKSRRDAMTPGIIGKARKRKE